MKVALIGRVLWGVVAVSSLMVAFVTLRAAADGAPTAEPLLYSGTLAPDPGAPSAKSALIAIRFWDAPEGGALKCERAAEDTRLDASGRFSVALPASCAAAVRAASDLWVEVEVASERLARTKIGAVPYALEAAHAADTNALQGVGVAKLEPQEGQVLRFGRGQWGPASNTAGDDDDIRWTILHGAAAAACAAAWTAGENAGPANHVVVARETAIPQTSCTDQCGPATGGDFPFCKNMMALGALKSGRASSSRIVSQYYPYGCDYTGSVGDEVIGGLLDPTPNNSSSYFAYCCCYRL